MDLEQRSLPIIVNIARAAKFQEKLASRLILEWGGDQVRLVAGADFGYDFDGQRIGAAIVVMTFPELEMMEVARAVRRLRIPYIPGFLSFREGPAFCSAFAKLHRRPDLTLIDGNGIAHPRRMGLASHVGVMLDIATIGCAKTPFFPFSPPGREKGAYTHYKNKSNERVGFCLRTRSGVKPVFASPGHRVDFRMTKKIVLSSSKFRLPEPLREAHRLARGIFRSSDLQKAGKGAQTSQDSHQSAAQNHTQGLRKR
jgi:deoxyribonuclease V